MADSPDDIAPLFTAVQLVRLRDKVMGSTNLNYSEWLEPMIGLELEASHLAASSNGGKKKPGARQKTTERQSLQWGLPFFERDFALWRGAFADEANNIAKFLSLLASLQLNVSHELEELKSLRQRNENALLRMEDFTKKQRSISAGEFDDNSSIYRQLLGIAGSLEKLKSRVDEKAEDAIRIIGLMTPSVDSQTLIDLLTGEV